MAVADFTGTGNLYLARAMYETGIRILTNTGAGPCGPWVERTDLPPKMLNLRTRAIRTGDRNRDGRTDIVALSEASGREGGDTTAMRLGHDTARLPVPVQKILDKAQTHPKEAGQVPVRTFVHLWAQYLLPRLSSLLHQNRS